MLPQATARREARDALESEKKTEEEEFRTGPLSVLTEAMRANSQVRWPAHLLHQLTRCCLAGAYQRAEQQEAARKN